DGGAVGGGHARVDRGRSAAWRRGASGRGPAHDFRRPQPRRGRRLRRGSAVGRRHRQRWGARGRAACDRRRPEPRRGRLRPRRGRPSRPHTPVAESHDRRHVRRGGPGRGRRPRRERPGRRGERHGGGRRGLPLRRDDLRTQAHLPASGPQTGLRFGLPLLFDGTNTLYVGAAETLPPTAADAGAIYALDFGSGVFLRSFEAPTPTAGALFGAAFALGGSTLIVGAPGTSVGGQTGAGAAYLLDATTGALLHPPLGSPNPTPAGAFGSAIALLGSTPLVGAPGESGAGQSGGGVVYAFDPTSGALAHTFT